MYYGPDRLEALRSSYGGEVLDADLTEHCRNRDSTLRSECGSATPGRATNGNSNAWLGQYFPKGTDLSGHPQRQLDHVAQS